MSANERRSYGGIPVDLVAWAALVIAVIALIVAVVD